MLITFQIGLFLSFVDHSLSTSIIWLPLGPMAPTSKRKPRMANGFFLSYGCYAGRCRKTFCERQFFFPLCFHDTRSIGNSGYEILLGVKHRISASINCAISADGAAKVDSARWA
ncbi:uncharacterized protein F4812DRAFT_424332 [Daldinia caldariorum]|uniref:uncharacterized protein n=1 Tax=Daldinia caldariorum TaxID=326644 RepID=UPI0020086F98|nr:uncharacterized protein F4812DRAFT_424332 [Daldinia caldariorum]KAI1468721.1 hypothetical protein F4812DRAFT_424332 [Daldinia caldariorum]